jgi:hypothetical protein
MTRPVLLLALVVGSAVLHGQVTPMSRYAWEMQANSPQTAQSYTYLAKDDVSPNGRALTGVTCTATAEPTTQTCVGAMPSYPPGPHTVTLTAVSAGAESPASAPPLTFTMQTTPPCGSPALTISVKSYTQTVVVGAQGNVAFQVLNAPRPVVLEQVRFGTQVVGEQQGTDLRASMGIYFSVPRILGPYAMTVYAKDTLGCEAVTTAPRTVTVQ